MIEQIAGAVLAVSLHGTTQPNVVPTWKRVHNTYYDARYEKFRKCVVKRESEGIPTVVNKHSHAQGLYQFLPTWTKSLSRKLNVRPTPIHTWPASVQTAGFWFALNHGRGAHHWSGGRWDCSRLLP